MRPAGADLTWTRWTTALDERLVLAAIERGRETWRTAESISAEIGVPLDRVRTVLDTTAADVIVSPGTASDARPRFSTRTHYRRTTSLLKRYLDALST